MGYDLTKRLEAMEARIKTLEGLRKDVDRLMDFQRAHCGCFLLEFPQEHKDHAGCKMPPNPVPDPTFDQRLSDLEEASVQYDELSMRIGELEKRPYCPPPRPLEKTAPICPRCGMTAIRVDGNTRWGCPNANCVQSNIDPAPACPAYGEPCPTQPPGQCQSCPLPPDGPAPAPELRPICGKCGGWHTTERCWRESLAKERSTSTPGKPGSLDAAFTRGVEFIVEHAPAQQAAREADCAAYEHGHCRDDNGPCRGFGQCGDYRPKQQAAPPAPLSVPEMLEMMPPAPQQPRPTPKELIEKIDRLLAEGDAALAEFKEGVAALNESLGIKTALATHPCDVCGKPATRVVDDVRFSGWLCDDCHPGLPDKKE